MNGLEQTIDLDLGGNILRVINDAMGHGLAPATGDVRARRFCFDLAVFLAVFLAAISVAGLYMLG
jgi:hypothetical protein